VPVAARIAPASAAGAWSATKGHAPSTGAPRGTVGKISEVTEPVVRTYLELDDLADLQPAGPPRVDDVAVEQVAPPDGALSRWLYAEVGRDYHWTDHLARSDAEWQAWADSVETWVATVAGDRAGYYELHEGDDGVQVAYFGLLRAFHGQGLGGFLLTHAVRRAFELAPRVWLHTCTLDGPAALPNYKARGLRPFRTQTL
jgi:GNAT superfamily N-acetyltransferase